MNRIALYLASIAVFAVIGEQRAEGFAYTGTACRGGDGSIAQPCQRTGKETTLLLYLKGDDLRFRNVFAALYARPFPFVDAPLAVARPKRLRIPKRSTSDGLYPAAVRYIGVKVPSNLPPNDCSSIIVFSSYDDAGRLVQQEVLPVQWQADSSVCSDARRRDEERLSGAFTTAQGLGRYHDAHWSFPSGMVTLGVGNAQCLSSAGFGRDCGGVTTDQIYTLHVPVDPTGLAYTYEPGSDPHGYSIRLNLEVGADGFPAGEKVITFP